MDKNVLDTVRFHLVEILDQQGAKPHDSATHASILGTAREYVALKANGLSDGFAEEQKKLRKVEELLRSEVSNDNAIELIWSAVRLLEKLSRE